MTEEEFEAIYTEETRSKAIVLLIYFSILMVVIPFSSMYYCYHHVFDGMFYFYFVAQLIFLTFGT